MKTRPISQSEKLKTLSANPYFQGLSEASLLVLSKTMELQHYSRGEVLFWEGGVCSGLYIIEHGSVKLFRTSAQGRQHIVRIMEEGETCNEVPVFDGGTNPINVEALDDTDVWVVEATAVSELMSTDPEFVHKIIQNLARMMRRLVNMVSEMAFYQVTNRLARLIAEIPADELNGEGPKRWTQNQLASRLGTVREVVARSLHELERSGAIEIESRRITIKDPNVLEQWIQPWH